MPQKGNQGPSGITTVEIKLWDPCWKVPLTAAVFDNTRLSYDLYNTQNIQYTDFSYVGNSAQCRGQTQELIYLSGPKSSLIGKNIENLYTVKPGSAPNSNDLTGMFKTFDWLGKHVFVVRGTVGSEDNSSTARGKNGFYNSIDSTPLILTITNPCDSAIVNNRGGATGSFVVQQTLSPREGESTILLIQDGPIDSISYKTGIVDFCGPLYYEITHADGRKPSGFSFKVDTLIGKRDKLFWQVETFEEGNAINVAAQIEVGLIDYLFSMPTKQKFDIVFRECAPRDFKSYFIPDQKVVVGERPVDVPIFFN